MGWLTQWDDLIHGTAVFAAVVPLGLALLLGWRLARSLWIATAGALGVSVLCIFGWPSWPLNGSEDVVITGLAAAVVFVALETVPGIAGLPGAVLHAIVWALFGVLFYPAGLAAEGGTTKRFLVAGAMGISISAWALLARSLAREGRGDSAGVFRLTPATWIPPSIAIAVILGLGASARFAQCAGALAAAIGGVCLLLVCARGQAGLRPLAALWGMLFALLAWAGWLFGEIQIGPTLALFLAPFAAVIARRLSLPRRTEFHEQLWDALAAAVVAVPVIAIAWHEYSKGGDAFGY